MVVLYLHLLFNVMGIMTDSQDVQSVETDCDLGVVIVAAGASRRMGGVDKILSPVLGSPLISYALRTFNNNDYVSSIVLVVSSHRLEECQRLVEEHGFDKVLDVCEGGKRRQDSVRLGLDRLGAMTWTMVHDGARPLVDDMMIEVGLAAASETSAAMAAVPLNDTIKVAGSDGIVLRTVDRAGLWAAQTPQVFRTDLLVEAHCRIVSDVTDDASMVENIGGRVKLFMGSYDNLKVTMPEDLLLVDALLRVREATV